MSVYLPSAPVSTRTGVPCTLTVTSASGPDALVTVPVTVPVGAVVSAASWVTVVSSATVTSAVTVT